MKNGIFLSQNEIAIRSKVKLLKMIEDWTRKRIVSPEMNSAYIEIQNKIALSNKLIKRFWKEDIHQEKSFLGRLKKGELTKKEISGMIKNLEKMI